MFNVCWSRTWRLVATFTKDGQRQVPVREVHEFGVTGPDSVEVVVVHRLRRCQLPAAARDASDDHQRLAVRCWDWRLCPQADDPID